ncbi:MAG: aspartate aminotransferase family protein [Candidatus Binatia bacterium]|nr:aspartate aminotransferase family protein [Candidatus Binatia bacterium]
MTSAEIIARNERYLFPVYPRAPLALVRGEGCRVWDADGREYLDFFSSTVVTNLGHAHPRVTAAIVEQAKTILHVSNLHHSAPQGELAELLCQHSFADRAFLCNSGAEANEAALKLARRFGSEHRGGRFEILTMLGSFHGRTLATLTATGQEKVREGFQPLPEGFRYVPFNDLGAIEAAYSPRTVAVMLELVQAEGGVVPVQPDYLRALRQWCDDNGVLLIFDEVQTGMGRLGTLFGYELFGVEPDVLTVAKGLGNGVPVGAMLARASVAESFRLGAHGSTFGGNALACAAAVATVRALLEDGVLENCRRSGAYLKERLLELASSCAAIREVRGHGLLLGVELVHPAAPVVDACRQRGLIVNGTAERVLRIAPPLIVSKAEIDYALGILAEVLRA